MICTRWLLPALALAPVCFVPCTHAAEPPLIASEQSEHVVKLRQADARLAQPVSLRARQVYLGSLLEQMSKQSGVILTVSDKGRAADTRVSVYAKAMPLGDVMDRMWSLLSYKGALWYWEKIEGAKGKVSYRLVRSLAARDFPARMEGRLQAKLEQDMEEALDALSLPRDQLAARGKRNKAIESMAKDPRHYSKMSALNAALSRDQIRSLMRGEKEFTLELSDLPQAVTEYVTAEQKLSPFAEGGGEFTYQPTPKATDHLPAGKLFDVSAIENGAVRFTIPKAPAPQASHIQMGRRDSPTELMPSVDFLYGASTPRHVFDKPIQLPGGKELVSFGGGMQWQGGVVSGGVPQERVWCDFQEDLWMLPKDKKTSPEQERKVPLDKKDLDAASIDDLLERMADRSGLAVFARVLPSEPFVRPEPRTVAAHLKNLRDRVYAYKWRGDSVLVADFRWWRYELLLSSKYPPGLLRQLTQDIENDPAQMLPLRSVCRIAAELENGVSLVPPGIGTQPWLPVLAPLAGKPELIAEMQTEAGLSCNRLPETSRRALYSLVREKTQQPPALGTKRLRVKVEDQATGKTVQRLLHFVLLSDDKEENLADLILGQREVAPFVDSP